MAEGTIPVSPHTSVHSILAHTPGGYLTGFKGALRVTHPETRPTAASSKQQATSESSARPRGCARPGHHVSSLHGTQKGDAGSRKPTGACMPTACDGTSAEKVPCFSAGPPVRRCGYPGMQGATAVCTIESVDISRDGQYKYIHCDALQGMVEKKLRFDYAGTVPWEG